MKMLLCLALLCVVHHVTASTDNTLVPGTSGSKVVQSVVSRIEASCVFLQTERKFARRSAYVESSDGLDPNTYRTGYHGGIWQVDQDMYDTTKAQSVYLNPELTNITQEFGINWQSTTWTDLRMPFYSGLAFRLFVTYSSQRGEIPWEIPDQAVYWQTNFRPSNPQSEYTNKANTLEGGCNSTTGPDLVFVLDASGSIGASNFQLVREFAANVVNEFNVSSTNTRVGVIKYSSTSTVEFYLNNYFNKQDVINHIMAMVYTGGGTNTHIALDMLVHQVMTVANGARADRPHVAVVMTDGVSNDPPLTILAAELAHNASITMLAVGVGANLNYNELWAIASPPKCTNQFFPKDFNDMNGVVQSIKSKVCEAPLIITPSDNGTEIGGVLPPGENHNCRFNVPHQGVTIKVYAWSGTVAFYVASDTYPNEDYYEGAAFATPGYPDALFVSHSTGEGPEDIMYCNIQGNGTFESNVSMETTPGDRDWCRSNPCQNGGYCQDHGNSGYTCECLAGWTGTHCETSNVGHCASEPCHSWATCQDYPDGYECLCDVGWNGTLCDNFLGYDCGARNPCTAENINAGEYYWPHIDPAKFVQCDDFGECHVMDCQPGTYWDWVAQTCMPPKRTGSGLRPVKASPEIKKSAPAKVEKPKQAKTPQKASTEPESKYMTLFRKMIREELARMEARLEHDIKRTVKKN